MQAPVIFTSQLMCTHTRKITQASIEINGNPHLSQICDGETSCTLAKIELVILFLI